MNQWKNNKPEYPSRGQGGAISQQEEWGEEAVCLWLAGQDTLWWELWDWT